MITAVDILPSIFLLGAASGCYSTDGLREPTKEERALIERSIEDYEKLKGPSLEITAPHTSEMDGVTVENILGETGTVLRDLFDSNSIFVASSITKGGDASGGYERRGFNNVRIVLDESILSFDNVRASVLCHEGTHGGQDALGVAPNDFGHTKDLTEEASNDGAASPEIIAGALDEEDAAYWLENLSAFSWIEATHVYTDYRDRYTYHQESFEEVYEEWSAYNCDTWVETQKDTFKEDLNLLVSQTGFSYSPEQAETILGHLYPFIGATVETSLRADEAASVHDFPEFPPFTACK